MSITTIQLELKPYIQPFEKDLAIKEAVRFFGKDVHITQKGTAEIKLRDNHLSSSQLLQFQRKSAYWLSVSHSSTHSVSTHPTYQSIWEATSEVARVNGSISIPLSFDINQAIKHLPNRRSLRYGVHGLHEYRGKYFPQLVRSLINISQGACERQDIHILDPMLGSGTTAIEASSLGYSCTGVDMNPLSVFMARTKSDLLHESYDSYVKQYKQFMGRLDSNSYVNQSHFHTFCANFANDDLEYLLSWFHPVALREIATLNKLIEEVDSPAFRGFLMLNLSNILRSASFQKEDDLRIRRIEKRIQKGDVLDRFRKAVKKSAASVSAFLYYKSDSVFGQTNILEGDARDFGTWGMTESSVDCVVTSPPYATALPYIDTDRLSLILLGLLEKRKLRNKEYEMIGNREITKKIGDQIWDAYSKDKHLLPASVVQMIGKIKASNTRNDVGFRRKNMPTLLAKYFIDMRKVFESLLRVMRVNADAFIVIGDNQTTSGNTTFNIRSTKYLREIAELAGFSWITTIPMDMLASRDIHKKNAMRSESIIWLKKL